MKEVITVVNGLASYTLSKVTAGVYNISATYSGDDKYLASSNSTSFVVGKFNSTVLVNVSNIIVVCFWFVLTTLLSLISLSRRD